MAEEDIYGSKKSYENFKKNLNAFAEKPKNERKRTYYCKNRENLVYFKKLFNHFEVRDLSYSRRNSYLRSFKLICYATEKNFKDCSREDIDTIMKLAHERNKSPNSKESFILAMKYLWKILFPELDEKGRPDETVFPYVVRHLKPTQDKSRQKLRNDRLTPEEFKRIVAYFDKDVRIQSFITLHLETCARPQELLYLRIRHVDVNGEYARLTVSEHGKEGVKLLQSIDSLVYLKRWLAKHPQKDEKDAFLFINLKKQNLGTQLRPENVNKHLRIACGDLGIDKRVTCYSLKRNGITFRRIRGDSDFLIQKVAGWTNLKQMATYDLSTQEDALRQELVEKGIVKDKMNKLVHKPRNKKCYNCGSQCAYAEELCGKCGKPVNIDEIQALIFKSEAFKRIEKIEEILRSTGIKLNSEE